MHTGRFEEELVMTTRIRRGEYLAVVMLPVLVSFLLAAEQVTAQTEASTAVPPDSLRSAESPPEATPKLDYRAGIALTYGTGSLNRVGLAADLASVGALDFRLGFVGEGDFAGRSDLVAYGAININVAYFGSSLSIESPSNDQIETSLWRFGLGTEDGYGYRFGTSGRRVVLSNVGAIVGGAYFFDWDDPTGVDLSAADSLVLDGFGRTARFGDMWEASAQVWFDEAMGARIGYERAVMYPCFKTWKWMGASLLYSITGLILEKFSEAAGKDAPGSVPIVDFLLEGALGYVYYELREESTNWPFDTEEPLSYDTFRLGVTYKF